MENFQSLSEAGYKVLINEKLSNYTTLGIGGAALGLVIAERESDLIEILKIVQKEKIKFMVIATGSDLLVSDDGYKGLVLVNKVKGINLIDKSVLVVKAGTVLQDLVDFANENGLAGLQFMAGIPGSVGGAIYGNAGAYGQTISDRLTSVTYFDRGEVKEFLKADCGFTYRSSFFKENKDLIILSAKFSLDPGNSSELIKISKETIELRSKKYPPGIKCPGSFFKNILVSELPLEVINKIPQDKIVYGKVPAGFLLEAVGANGDKLGGIEIASYHGNLFMNVGDGTSDDFFSLAKKYKKKVQEKFNINMEAEVQLVGFEEKI